MKHIVNRKLYDTETATLLYEYDRPAGKSGILDRNKRRLYKTPNGNYFFVVSEVRGRQQAIQAVIVLTLEEVMQRLEEDHEIDALLVLFGDKIEEA